jgi:hypothetical protein
MGSLLSVALVTAVVDWSWWQLVLLLLILMVALFVEFATEGAIVEFATLISVIIVSPLLQRSFDDVPFS